MHIFTLLAAFIFLLNQVIEKGFGIYIPFWHAYGDDLMAMPVILGGSLFVMQKIHPIGHLYHFSKKHVLLAVVFYSMLFEGVLPLFSNTYVADIWDIICYISGAILFQYIVNLPIEKKFLQFQDLVLNKTNE
jgi:hypothetical protein